MTHALIAPERPDEGFLITRALSDHALEIDRQFGPDMSAHLLEKAIPMAAKVIQQATPGADAAIPILSKRYVRHDVAVDETDPSDQTSYGKEFGGTDVIFEKPLPGAEVEQHSRLVFTPKEGEVVREAIRKTAIDPKHEGDDLAALDFLAENSTSRLEAGASRMILETTRRHKRTRAFLTSFLLRIV